MENSSLGSIQMDVHAQWGGGGTSMFDSLGMCRSAWYRFLGSSMKKAGMASRNNVIQNNTRCFKSALQ